MAKKNGLRNKKTRTATNEKNRKIISWMWRIFGIFILLNILIFGLLSAGVIGYIPNLDDLENPIDKYASQVISSDDKLLFTYSQSDDNRIFTDYSQLSPYLIQALVATEDVRFYQHSGIDIIGLGRAVVKTLLLQHESSGGGSTITQQLAKQLYSPRAKNKSNVSFKNP
jgi:penicillin-binding protein 1A